MIDQATIRKMTEEHLAGSSLFLIDVIIKPGNIILVFIDSDQEVKISDCADLSHYIESRLNRDEEDYELRVSSAGIDHPYRYLRQYRKNIGRQVQVSLMDGSVLKGTLIGAGEESIEVMPLGKKGKKEEPVEKPLQLRMDQIKETRGIVTFD
jgi:ribosome maturation factor RimP